jgi:hypothetical protein
LLANRLILKLHVSLGEVLKYPTYITICRGSKMVTLSKYVCYFFALVLPISLSAQQYPEMTGVWKGQIRIVESPNLDGIRLQVGGVIIREVDLVLTKPIPVYGSIRSTGTQGLFIDSLGGHGQLWFKDENSFEYCYTSMVDGTITSYCARLQKE